ncbi:hypothetical protein WMF37_49445 [Sorangium sp. So ce291]|uniref:hypothetical protein n=1 Tax=Sorangium sp. So ce291 TaxID=3133294 RepID=UPI003F5FF575
MPCIARRCRRPGKHTNFSIESFASKNALGLQKADFTKINLTSNDLKIEFTAYAASRGGYKGETWIDKSLTYASLFETLGANVRKFATEAWISAARILNSGFTKM